MTTEWCWHHRRHLYLLHNRFICKMYLCFSHYCFHTRSINKKQTKAVGFSSSSDWSSTSIIRQWKWSVGGTCIGVHVHTVVSSMCFICICTGFQSENIIKKCKRNTANIRGIKERQYFQYQHLSRESNHCSLNIPFQLIFMGSSKYSVKNIIFSRSVDFEHFS